MTDDERTVEDDGVTYEVVWNGALSRQAACTALSSPFIQRRERVAPGYPAALEEGRGRHPRLPVAGVKS